MTEPEGRPATHVGPPRPTPKETKFVRPHAHRYPWDAWFKRRGEVVLTAGVDFFCLAHGMAQALYRQGLRRGKRITMRIGRDTVAFRVIGKCEPRSFPLPPSKMHPNRGRGAPGVPRKYVSDRYAELRRKRDGGET